MKEGRLPEFVFRFRVNQLNNVGLMERGTEGWSYPVRAMLDTLHAGRLLSQRNVSTEQWTDLKRQFDEHCSEEADAELEAKSSLTLFRRFGAASPCGILQRTLNHAGAKLRLRLRCGGAPIMEAAAAWNKVPREERKCRICNEGFVEDAEHFTSRCSVYADLRDDCRQRMQQVIDEQSDPELRQAIRDFDVELILGDKWLVGLSNEKRIRLDSIICGYLKVAWRRREPIWKTLCAEGSNWQLR